jgi:hypothetical protein
MTFRGVTMKRDADSFPEPRKDAVERMKAFQSLSPQTRRATCAAIIEIGWKLIQNSPHCEAILRRMDESEEEWRRIQRELIADYEQGLLPPTKSDESLQGQVQDLGSSTAKLILSH